MSQLMSIFLTSGLTIFGGVVVLILGEVVKGAFILPIQDLARLRGKINYALIFYANVISNPGLGSPEHLQEVQTVLRHRASQLLSKSNAIPWYGVWHRLGFLPKRGNIERASMLLIGLSNSIFKSEYGERNDNYRMEILWLVGISKNRKHPVAGASATLSNAP